MKEKRFSVEQIVGMLRQQDQVWMVDPGYPGALQTLRNTGGHIVPVPVNEDGLIVQIGACAQSEARLCHASESISC